MLFKQDILEGILAGNVTCAYRRWKEPRVKAGSELRTPIGVVVIRFVEEVPAETLTEEDARRAGYSSLAELIKGLNAYTPEGPVHRIGLSYGGEDPRIALREQDSVTTEEWAELRQRLQRLDKAGKRGPWTTALLLLLQDYPGMRAGELAEKLGWEKEKLKLDVRKLKELGLTISLGTGYKLSPRGEMLLSRMESEQGEG